MRTFEERKAEVMRRSEHRIQKRKRKQIRILTLLIPMCLILTLWSVAILPVIFPEESDDTESESIANVSSDSTGTENTGAPNLVHSFVLIDVTGTGAHAQCHLAISDTPAINSVVDHIYSILIPHASHDEIVGDFSDDTGYDEVHSSSTDTKSSCYFITMTTETGTNRNFKLTDNKLYDADLNIEICLSDEALNSLKFALGLTD